MTASSNSSNAPQLQWIAALLGSTGVAAGAFGAHLLKDVLAKRGTTATWNTAVLYQLVHATAVLAIVNNDATATTTNKTAGTLMGIGTLLFSGSLYGLSLGYGPKALLGPITPIGGLLMIGGWIAVGLSSNTKGKEQ